MSHTSRRLTQFGALAALGIIVSVSGCPNEAPKATPPAGATGRILIKDIRIANRSAIELLDSDPDTSIAVRDASSMEIRFWRSVTPAGVLIRSTSPVTVTVASSGNSIEPVVTFPVGDQWQAVRTSSVSVQSLMLKIDGESNGRITDVMAIAETKAGLFAKAEDVVASAELDPGTALVLGEPDNALLLTGGNECVTMELPGVPAPAQIGRAWVAGEATGLAGLWSLSVSLNGTVLDDAQWVPISAGMQEMFMRVPHTLLVGGNNALALCLPQGTTGPVRLQRIRLVAEVERTLIAEPASDDAIKAVDGDVSTVPTNPVVVLDVLRAGWLYGLEILGDGNVDSILVDGERVTVETDVPLVGGRLLRVEGTLARGNIEVHLRGTVGEVRPLMVPQGPRRHSPTLVIDEPHAGNVYGQTVIVTGFVHGGDKSEGPVRLLLNGAGMVEANEDAAEGWFALSGMLPAPLAGETFVTLRAELPDGSTVERVIPLRADAWQHLAPTPRSTTDDPARERGLYGLVGETSTGTFQPGQAGEVRLGSEVRLYVPGGALRNVSELSITRASEAGVHPLNPGMLNVTAPGGGMYQFLPSGTQFEDEVTISLPIDPAKVPSGMSLQEIKTYFFNEATQQYDPLETLMVDESRLLVLSNTTHFTDMINAVIIQPESPTAEAFNPNAVSGMAAANPAAGITMVEVPQPRQDGSAAITYPFALPPARGGYQPQLALTYSSEGGHGVAGWGWNLNVSAIEVETRFGTPQYEIDPTEFGNDALGISPNLPLVGERYLLDGQSIVPAEREPQTTCTSKIGGQSAPGLRFVMRKEGRFARILRCGTSHDNYWWQVTDKNGVTMEYGSDAESRVAEVRLVSCDTGNIGKWLLRAVADADGNRTDFHYQKRFRAPGCSADFDGAANALQPTTPWVGRELIAIEYTHHAAGPASAYRVTVDYERRGGGCLNGIDPSELAAERLLNSRYGFNVLQDVRVRKVTTYCNRDCGGTDKIIRQYVLHYEKPSAKTLYKNLLTEVQECGGCCTVSDDPTDATDACAPTNGCSTTVAGYSTKLEYTRPCTIETGTGTNPDPDCRPFSADNNRELAHFPVPPYFHGVPMQGTVDLTFSAGKQHGMSAVLSIDQVKGTVGLAVDENGQITRSDTTQALMDINGDGLPDIVSHAKTAEDALLGYVGRGNLAQRIAFNTGNGFVEAAEGQRIGDVLATDPNLTAVDEFRGTRTLSGGLSGGMNFNVGWDIGGAGIGLPVNATANVVDLMLMDADGDGLVDEVGPLVKLQKRSGGRITFEDQASDGLAQQCGSQAPELPDGVAQVVSILKRDTERRDVVIRWRAPRSGNVHVEVTATPLAVCERSQPPSIRVTTVPAPRAPKSGNLPIPSYISFDMRSPDGGIPYIEEVLEQSQETWDEMSADLADGGFAPHEEIVSAANPFGIEPFNRDVKRGGEILFGFTAGTDCSDEELQGAADALATRIHIQYTDCGGGGCKNPVTDAEGVYDSVDDFRVTSLGAPLRIDRPGVVEWSGSVKVGLPLADDVDVTLERLRCSPGLFGSIAGDGTKYDFPWTTGNVPPLQLDSATRALDDLNLDRIAHSVGLLKRFAQDALVNCKRETLFQQTLFANDVDAIAEIRPTCESCGFVDVGDVIIARVHGRTPIDPNSLDVVPFTMKYTSYTGPSAFDSLPINLDPVFEPTTPDKPEIQIPLAVDWRRLEASSGEYDWLTRGDGQDVKVRVLLPPSLLCKRGDDQCIPPMLLVQQGQRLIERIEIRTDPIAPACPAAFSNALRGVMACTLPGCCQDSDCEECFKLPEILNPSIQIDLNAGLIAPNEPFFISFEPPRDVLNRWLMPRPGDLLGMVAYFSAWASLSEDEIRNVARFVDTLVLTGAIRASDRSLPDGVSLLTATVGNGLPTSRVNVLVPEGTMGLFLPVPLPTMNAFMTTDGFHQWGYAEYRGKGDPGEPVFEMPTEEFPVPNISALAPRAFPSELSQAALLDTLGSKSSIQSMEPTGLPMLPDFDLSMVGRLPDRRSDWPLLEGGAPEQVDKWQKWFRKAFDFGAPRLTGLTSNLTGYSGTCAGSGVFNGYVSPGRCVVGDTRGIVGMPRVVTTLRSDAQTLMRKVACPRGVPRVSVAAAIGAGVHFEATGVKETKAISQTITDYRDMTGDGIPDVLWHLPGRYVVLKSERNQPRGVPFVPLVSAMSPPMDAAATLSVGGGNDLATNVIGAFKAASGGQLGREGTFGLSVAGEVGLRLDLSTLQDVNGDGLPDLVGKLTPVECDGLMVQLNNRGRFTNPPICFNQQGMGVVNAELAAMFEGPTAGFLLHRFGGLSDFVPLGGSLTHSVNGQMQVGLSTKENISGAGYASVSASQSGVFEMLLDIDGDGLVDRVRRVGDLNIRVNFNLGSGFSPEVAIPVADMNPVRLTMDGYVERIDERVARVLKGLSDRVGVPQALMTNSGFTFAFGGGGGGQAPTGVATSLLMLSMTFGLQGSVSVATNSTPSMMADIDGDGLAEPVRKEGQEVVAAVNQLGKYNQLKKITTPLDGVVELEYTRVGNTFDMPQSRYALKKVTTSSGVKNRLTATGTIDDGKREWTISYAHGVYDRHNREFFGFEHVNTREQHGDGRVRSTCATYDVSDYAHAGLLSAREMKAGECDGGELLSEEIQGYYPPQTLANIGDPRLCPRPTPLRDDGCESKVVFAKDLRTRSYEPSPLGTLPTSRKAEVIEEFDEFGNVTRFVHLDDEDDLNDDVTVEVQYASVGTAYLASLPVSHRVHDISGLRRFTEAQYSKTGHLEALKKHHETGTLTWKYTYDKDLGTLLSRLEPTGYLLEVDEFDSTKTYPTRIRDNLDQEVEADWDLRFGLKTHSVDPNGSRMRLIPDDYGRIVEVEAPLGPKPAISVEFGCLGTARCAKTTHAPAPGSTYRPEIFTVVDGYGKGLWTASTAVKYFGDANPEVRSYTVSGLHLVDDWGRTVRTSKPLLMSESGFLSGPGAHLTQNIDVLRPTTLELDVRDRITKVIEPPNRATTTVYAPVEVEGFPRLGRLTTDELGKVTVQRLDGDQVLEVVEVQGTPSRFPTTKYRYDELDQLELIVDADENEFTLQYDMLGRQKLLSTPDTGTKTWTFDAAGRLDEVKDAEGRITKHHYDTNSTRLIRLERGDGAVVMEWGRSSTPDAVAKKRLGRMWRVTYDQGSVDEFVFDALGQQVERKRTYLGSLGPIPLPSPISFVVNRTFDAFGRTISLQYPDGERLDYTYNDAGLVRTATGTKDGVVRDYGHAFYDEYGRRVVFAFNNGFRTSYEYDADAEWLNHVRTTSGAGGTTVWQNLAYLHDDVGNINEINGAGVTAPGIPSSSSFSFDYDDRHRLTHASQSLSWGGLSGATRSLDERFTWTDNHNLKHRSRTELVDGFVGPRALWSSEPTYDKAHRLTALTETGIGALTHTRTYDRAGFVTLARHGKDDTWEEQANTWTADGMLRKVVVNGQTLTNEYSANAERVRKRSQHGDFIFAGPELTRGPTGWSKHIFVGGTRVATTVTTPGTRITDPPVTTANYYLSDHIGSVMTVVGEDGALVNQVVLSAFGEKMFETTDADGQSEQFALTGHPLEFETKKYHLQWREHDPRFLGFDAPEPFFADQLKQGPTGLNTYQYGLRNPIGVADPNGRLPPDSRAWDRRADAFMTEIGGVSEGEREAAREMIQEALVRTQADGTPVLNFLPPADFIASAENGVNGVIQNAEAAGADLGEMSVNGPTRETALMTVAHIGGAAGGAAAIGLTGAAMAKVGGGAATGRSPGCIGCPCFVPGTLILMADGSSKPIEDVVVGDMVLAAHPEIRGAAAGYRVASTMKNFAERIIRVEIGTGREPATVEATREHPFWTVEHGWVAAHALRAGNTLLDHYGRSVEIFSVVDIAKTTPTYNLAVDGVHTYFVVVGPTAVLVHNQNIDLGEGYTGRVDSFNTKGNAGFEVHVYDPTGKEVGVHGQADWIPKHGHRAAPDLPGGVQNRLKGQLIHENRIRGYLPPKGKVDITGDRWKAIVRAACP